jgi:hypothetical protein
VSLRQFIVMGADPNATGGQKVMVSHDGGETFTDLTANLPKADAHRIVLRSGQLYVATDVGVFTAPAGGTQWKRFGSGLPQVTYRSMQLDPTGRYLTVGAYGRGGWVYDFASDAPATLHAAAVHALAVAGHAPGSAHSGAVAANSPADNQPAVGDKVGRQVGGSLSSPSKLNASLASTHGAPSTALVLLASGLLVLSTSGMVATWYRRRSYG